MERFPLPNEVQQLILSVLNGEQASVALPMHPMQAYTDFFESQKCTVDIYEANGWQVDFWQNIIKDNVTYCLAGSF